MTTVLLAVTFRGGDEPVMYDAVRMKRYRVFAAFTFSEELTGISTGRQSFVSWTSKYNLKKHPGDPSMYEPLAQVTLRDHRCYYYNHGGSCERHYVKANPNSSELERHTTETPMHKPTCTREREWRDEQGQVRASQR